MNDLREDLKKGKVIFGLQNTMKKLKKGEAKKVYISFNCPDKEGIMRQAKLTGVELIQLEETNNQLGVICKKPYAISVLCFL